MIRLDVNQFTKNNKNKIMNTTQIIFILCILLLASCHSNDDIISDPNKKIILHLSPYVRNAENFLEKQILAKWQTFIENDRYYEWESEDLMWSDKMHYPMLPLSAVLNKDVLRNHHFNILGIYPVDSSLYCIHNSLITQKSDTLYPVYQSSVYAKLIEDEIRFMSKPQFLKTKWQHEKVGTIDYYFDWDDHLNMKDAVYFNNFNNELADKFNADPIVY